MSRVNILYDDHFYKADKIRFDRHATQGLQQTYTNQN